MLLIPTDFIPMFLGKYKLENILFFSVVDCEWNEWSSWSDCNNLEKDCAAIGSRNRTRTIEQEEMYGGVGCKIEDGDDQQKCIKSCEGITIVNE